MTSHNTSSSPQPGAISLSTNNANDLLLGFVGAQIGNYSDSNEQSPGSFGSASAAYIAEAENGVGSFSYASDAAAEGIDTSSTQSGATVSWGKSWVGTTTSSYLIADAIQAGAGGSCVTLTPGVNFITSVTASCIAVPSNWNSADNTVELIGGGGGAGGTLSSFPLSGGGGGAYASASNISLTPGGIVYIQVGNGGLASSPDGGSDTVFNSLEPSCVNVSSPALCAQGGGVGIGDSGGGAGGSASASVGTTKYSGGAAGNSNSNSSGAGGGGAGGPHGAGGAGYAASGNSYSYGGTGGGGGGGGTSGSDQSSGVGGTGGNNYLGAGGGAGGTAGAGSGSGGAGSAGTAGGGGGGGGNTGFNLDSAGNGGAGGNGTDWDAAHGAGGGGGGSGAPQGAATQGTGGAGGLYGAGGGGGAAGGNGAQGIIVITYTPLNGRIIRLTGHLVLIGGVRLGGTSPIPRSTFSTLSIDGTPNTNTATGASTITVPLTTSLTNDIIVVDVHNEVPTSNGAGVTVQSVTAPGLTFAERSSLSEAGTEYTEYDDLERWWALATSTFSGTITVTFNAAIDDASVVAYGVHGANTSSPWDADGPFTYYYYADPSGSVTPTISSVSTAAANTMLLAAASNGNELGGADQTAGSGYTLIGTTFTDGGVDASSIGSEYQVFSSPQSNITVPFGSTYNKDFEMIVDAIRAAP